jgi:hypothetical protein
LHVRKINSLTTFTHPMKKQHLVNSLTQLLLPKTLGPALAHRRPSFWASHSVVLSCEPFYQPRVIQKKQNIAKINTFELLQVTKMCTLNFNANYETHNTMLKKCPCNCMGPFSNILTRAPSAQATPLLPILKIGKSSLKILMTHTKKLIISDAI